MEQLYALSYSYYQKFYSYTNYWKSLLGNFVSTIIPFASFIYFAIDFISDDFGNKKFTLLTLKDTAFIGMIVSEIILLIALDKLKGKKDRLVLNNLNIKLIKNELILEKRKWIKNNMGVSVYDFQKSAEKFDSIIMLYNKYKSSFEKNKNSFFYSIYDPSSKARLITFLIYVLSLFSLMAIKNSQGIGEFLYSFDFKSFRGFLVMGFVLSVFLLACIHAMKYVLFIVENILSIFLLKIDKKNAKTERVVNYFIRDLIALGRLELFDVSVKAIVTSGSDQL